MEKEKTVFKAPELEIIKLESDLPTLSGLEGPGGTPIYGNGNTREG